MYIAPVPFYCFLHYFKIRNRVLPFIDFFVSIIGIAVISVGGSDLCSDIHEFQKGFAYQCIIFFQAGLIDFHIKIGILVIGAFMVLNQLGIATKIVNSAFVIILAALGVAFAIAFGIGGRDFAKKTLDDASKKLEENKKK